MLLKIACKLAIKIETVSFPCNPSDVFLTASARVYQKHVLHGQETVSIFIVHATPILSLSRNNQEQVVHGRVPLSNSIIWYQQNGGDALWLGR